MPRADRRRAVASTPRHNPSTFPSSPHAAQPERSGVLGARQGWRGSACMRARARASGGLLVRSAGGRRARWMDG
eukprot:scaffold4477_cov417-Prasinococcus_capsulatus_cf.AAC.8